MKNISVMFKPASSLCNMRCRYCFYRDVSSAREIFSYGIMSNETASTVLEHLFCDLTAGDYLTIGFQGGEPTVAGLEFYRYFVAEAEKYANGIHLSWAFQTNGLLLNSEWCRFLSEHRFLVGLSLDLLPEIHDYARVDANDTGTFNRVMHAKELLERHHVEYNILSVLTNSLARHPHKVWNLLVQYGIQYVQFIPCLNDFDTPRSSFALTPQRFASFYSKLFQQWLDAYLNGKYRSIKLFDDIISLLSSGQPTACGITGRCSSQIVVESDGSTYPCDFYVLDEYKTGKLTEQTLSEIYLSPTASRFIDRELGLPTICRSCRYINICGGGCKRMRHEVFFNNEKGSFCGYRSFLDACLPEMFNIAQKQRAHRFPNV